MEITLVKVKLVARSSNKLVAFASVTFDDCFVVRDIKIIRGDETLFIAMPSRKITDHCKKCRAKNPMQAKFCSQCGAHLPEKRLRPDGRGRAKLHADIAHPTKPEARQMIQDAVLQAYAEEYERSRVPGYRPAVHPDDFDEGPEDGDNGNNGNVGTQDESPIEPAPPGVNDNQPLATKTPEERPSPAPRIDGDNKGFGILA
ncbi:MAG TPA: SpoVG family protein [Planctomycetota bacterium]|jgi:stage V sporulation protein G